MMESMESMESEFSKLLKAKRSVEVIKNDKKTENVLILLELITFILGYVIIVYSLGFLIGFGFWMVIWSNNLATQRFFNGKK